MVVVMSIVNSPQFALKIYSPIFFFISLDLTITAFWRKNLGRKVFIYPFFFIYHKNYDCQSHAENVDKITFCCIWRGHWLGTEVGAGLGSMLAC